MTHNLRRVKVNLRVYAEINVMILRKMQQLRDREDCDATVSAPTTDR